MPTFRFGSVRLPGSATCGAQPSSASFGPYRALARTPPVFASSRNLGAREKKVGEPSGLECAAAEAGRSGMVQNPSNLIWIDLEMTGLRPERHHIIEVATVVTSSTLEVLAHGPDLVIGQPEAVVHRELAPRREKPPALGGQLRRRDLCRRARERGAAALRALSARLPGPQPRALRARPGDVLRAAAEPREDALRPGAGGLRHHRQAGRLGRRDLCRQDVLRRGRAPHRHALPALSPGARRADRDDAARLRRGLRAGLPLDALGRRADGPRPRHAPPRHRAGRPLRRLLRAQPWSRRRSASSAIWASR